MADLYTQRGCTVSFIEDVHFLKIERDGVHAVFNQLEFDGDTALWRHAGKEGTVYFPKAWLAQEPHNFYGTPVLVSGIAFEYAIKTQPQLLSPLWKRRPKDTAALQWLSRQLEEQQIIPQDVLQKIWSYNPFWARRGYPEYDMPSVAWRLDPLA